MPPQKTKKDVPAGFSFLSPSFSDFPLFRTILPCHSASIPFARSLTGLWQRPPETFSFFPPPDGQNPHPRPYRGTGNFSHAPDGVHSDNRWHLPHAAPESTAYRTGKNAVPSSHGRKSGKFSSAYAKLLSPDIVTVSLAFCGENAQNACIILDIC